MVKAKQNRFYFEEKEKIKRLIFAWTTIIYQSPLLYLGPNILLKMSVKN